MAGIRHHVGIEAPTGQVYGALATAKGLSGWWALDVDGDPEIGGSFRFFSGSPEPRVVMAVMGLTPDRHVGWRCTVGPNEWVGTTFSLDLTASEGETGLLLTNAGWDEPVEFLHHCGTKWAYVLLGLKGRARRWPGHSVSRRLQVQPLGLTQ